jgi:hypothetical protein
MIATERLGTFIILLIAIAGILVGLFAGILSATLFRIQMNRWLLLIDGLFGASGILLASIVAIVRLHVYHELNSVVALAFLSSFFMPVVVNAIWRLVESRQNKT